MRRRVLTGVWSGILGCAAMLSLLAAGCGAETDPPRVDRGATPTAPVPEGFTPEPPPASTPEPPTVAPSDEGVEPILRASGEDPAAVVERPAPPPICRGIRPARQAERGRGHPVDLVGRVVSPSGEGVSGATVTLVDLAVPALEQRPRYGTRALVEARTDDDGCFGIQGAGDGIWDALSLRIEARGMRRSFDLRRLQDRSLRVRLAPSRPVRIIVECGGEAAEGGVVTGYWHGGDARDVFASRWLLPPGVTVPEDLLRPNSDRASPSTARAVRGATGSRPGARRSTEVRLPVGTSTLVVDSACGLGLHEIEVAPGRGRLRPIRIRLPHPDSGSISIRLREPPPANAWADHERVTLRRGDFHEEYLVLRRDGEMATIEGLPPGEYQLGSPGRPGCLSTIELAPGEHRTMILDNQDCRVWRWRRPDYY